MRISDWSSDVCSSDLNDTVARLSGDEFTLVLEDISDLATVERKAQIIIDSFTASLDIDDQRDVSTSPSTGISVYPDHGLVPTRPEERRVGKECDSTCRSRGSPDP